MPGGFGVGVCIIMLDRSPALDDRLVQSAKGADLAALLFDFPLWALVALGDVARVRRDIQSDEMFATRLHVSCFWREALLTEQLS